MESIKLNNGLEICKRCLSCKYATAFDDKFIYCENEGIPVEKNLCCFAYEVHPKFNRIGSQPGKVKPKEYFNWQLSLIDKCKMGKDTNWKKYDALIEPFKKNMYKYWLNNVKGK